MNFKTLCLALIFGATFAASASAEEVRIFSGSSPSFAPIFVADQQGYFKEEGLEATVRPFPSGAEATEGFRSGAADFLVAADVPLMYLLASGDVALVAQLSQTSQFLSVVGPKGKMEAADIKGQKIGLVSKSASEYMLSQFLKSKGLGLGDVERVNLAPFDLVSAAVRGDIYAASTWKPFDGKIEQLGQGNLANAGWNGDVGYVMYSGIVVKRELAEKNPALVEKVVRGLHKASDYLQKTSAADSSAQLAGYLKAPAADVQQVLEVHGWDMQVNAQFRSGMEAVGQFLYEQKLIPQQVDWQKAYDWTALKAVDPALVQ